MDREDHDIRRVERENAATERFEVFRAEEAGALSGRIGFRSSDPEDSKQVQQRQSSKQQAALTALDLALADPGYRALYNDTLDMLQDAEIRTARALEKAQDDLKIARQKLEDTLQRAARLYPDSVAVFRDKDGNVYTEHGALVTGEQAESIVWPNDAPDHLDFLADQKAVSEMAKYVERLRDYQTNTLGNTRDRFDTSAASGTKIDEKDLKATQEAIEEGLNQLLLTEPEAPSNASNIGSASADFSLPTNRS